MEWICIVFVMILFLICAMLMNYDNNVLNDKYDLLIY